MLKILIPVVAMIVGVAAGVFLGTRRRSPNSADGSAPGSTPGHERGNEWLARLSGSIAKITGWIQTVSGSATGRLEGMVHGTQQTPRSQEARPAATSDAGGPAEAASKAATRPPATVSETHHSAVANAPRTSEAGVNLSALNCRARIGREPKGDIWQTILVVDICGAIEAPDDGHDVDLRVTLNDVTDRKGQSPLPVLVRPKNGPINRTSEFSYQTEIGKLCQQHTVLEDWTAVAQISPEWFVLPRQGHRELRFNIAIVSRATSEELATGTCIGAFENLEIGYLDIDDNIQRAKTLAVGLAFSVGAANNALQEPEINVIHGWVRTNFGSGNASEGARLELDQALRKTAGFFLRGGRLNLEEVCREIVEIAPMVGRLDIMDLSLRVAGAKGQVTPTDIRLLKDLAQWLQIDRTRLRAMVEKQLPVSMHQSEDAEMILGVTTEMSKDEVRSQLNREYVKWSSRVISSDPAIRQQADQMLNLIANARTQYIGVKLSK